MAKDFTNIEYLKSGNERQQSAYLALSNLSVFEKLQAYTPILTGTIPIGIDLPESDLDIICECSDHKKFTEKLTSLYSNKDSFEIRRSIWNGLMSTIVSFISDDFEIEIFGQDCSTINQNAYRHMIIEHDILNSKDDDFRRKIVGLKREGLKTEAAFTKLLGLKGDSYEELLKFEKKTVCTPIGTHSIK